MKAIILFLLISSTGYAEASQTLKLQRKVAKDYYSVFGMEFSSIKDCEIGNYVVKVGDKYECYKALTFVYDRKPIQEFTNECKTKYIFHNLNKNNYASVSLYVFKNTLKGSIGSFDPVRADLIPKNQVGRIVEIEYGLILNTFLKDAKVKRSSKNEIELKYSEQVYRSLTGLFSNNIGYFDELVTGREDFNTKKACSAAPDQNHKLTKLGLRVKRVD